MNPTRYKARPAGRMRSHAPRASRARASQTHARQPSHTFRCSAWHSKERAQMRRRVRVLNPARSRHAAFISSAALLHTTSYPEEREGGVYKKNGTREKSGGHVQHGVEGGAMRCVGSKKGGNLPAILAQGVALAERKGARQRQRSGDTACPVLGVGHKTRERDTEERGEGARKGTKRGDWCVRERDDRFASQSKVCVRVSVFFWRAVFVACVSVCLWRVKRPESSRLPRI